MGPFCPLKISSRRDHSTKSVCLSQTSHPIGVDLGGLTLTVGMSYRIGPVKEKILSRYKKRSEGKWESEMPYQRICGKQSTSDVPNTIWNGGMGILAGRVDEDSAGTTISFGHGACNGPFRGILLLFLINHIHFQTHPYGVKFFSSFVHFRITPWPVADC